MPGQLVTIGSYSTPYEACLVKGELEAFDIDATLADDNAVRINWLWSNAFGGVKVQVPESELESALAILKAAPVDEPEAQEPPPAVVCPNCGSAETHYFLDKRGSFLTWLVLGVPFLPVVSRRECAACGTDGRRDQRQRCRHHGRIPELQRI